MNYDICLQIITNSNQAPDSKPEAWRSSSQVLDNMDSNLLSSTSSGADVKADFRKPLSDAANRKYRRRSPLSGSSSSDGSPNHEHNSSPIPSREHDRRRKDDERDLDRDSGRSQYRRSGDSYRHFDRQLFRSSQSYRRHDDYSRREKNADDNERDSHFSSRSGRESRGGTNSDYMRREREHSRPRDHLRDVEKHSVGKFDGSGHRSRDKDREISSLEYRRCKDKEPLSDSDRSGRRHSNSNTDYVKSEEWDRHKGDRDGRNEKRDHCMSLGDYRSDRSPTHGEYKGHQTDSPARRDSSGRRLKEASRIDTKELDGHKYQKEETKKYDDREANRQKERYNREAGEQLEDRTVFTSKDQESLANKSMLFGSDGGTDHGKDVVDERQSLSSKQVQESVGKVTSERTYVTDSDIDAAKVAAMKAAELGMQLLHIITVISGDLSIVKFPS
ncbi:unnamed protein product [Ilex paraguariensis]|uniref:Uncharacterized protein n=1 Tax=Ilex paraguariensis TaxID=185542 RepID=A0ABC8V561_9AQUA